MAVTIKDVAKRAQVSPSTVSRVISGSPDISEKTKEKVQIIIEDMGYHINLNARGLVEQSNKTIGIVMKHSTNEMFHSSFFSDVLLGINELCRKRGYQISLIAGNTEEEIFLDTKNKVKSKQIDGIIVPYSKSNDRVVPFLVESEFPFVMIGRPTNDTKDIVYVDNDNIQAAKDATNYLIKKGHRKIAYIGDDPSYEVAKSRMGGFKQAMNEHQLKVPKEYTDFIKFDPEIGKKIIDRLLKLQCPPTAIVVTDDFNALIAISAIRDMGYTIPNDISIISFNNSIISQVTSPSLTSVDVQVYQLGYESARCVLEEINESSKVKRSVIIPTLIHERSSVSVNLQE